MPGSWTSGRSASANAPVHRRLADRLFTDPGSLLGDRHSPWTRDQYLRLITEGGFPEVLSIRSASVRRSWYDGYLNTVIIRDIGDFASIRNAEAIRKFSHWSPAFRKHPRA